MATPVLVTKLFIPPSRPRAVVRPRLIERLNEGLRSGSKLILISAPAGFGKTTMLSEWIASCQRRKPKVQVGWLSLDERDNDPSRFLTYLVAALQNVDAGIGLDDPNQQSSQPQPAEPTLTAVINEVAQSPHHIIMVLDDFHLVEAAPIRDALNFLLDHLPSNLHLAIASRSDPLIPLARLRARGELTELRAADLRFSLDEAAVFLNQVMNLRLSAGDIAALESRTEGWIAGLQLAALSMRDSTDVAGFIHAFTGSHRFVIDYLVEEVLLHQPEHVRRFLFQTAILDRLSGSLCEAVTGQEDASMILEALERGNLFVVPMDDRRQWYRYHHLFADVLRARFLKEGRDHIPGLHGLASQWYERNNLPEDSVRHALAAEDFERAAILIETALPDMRRRRQDAMLLGWLKTLPDDVVRRKPVLSVFCAHMMLVSGDLDAVAVRLRDAEQGLAALTGAGGLRVAPGAEISVVNAEELRTLPVTIAVYRASLAQAVGDVAGTAEHAQRALELAQPNDHLGRASAAGFLGLASWAYGDLEAALRSFAEVSTSLRMAGNTADVLGTTIVRADLLITQGRLHEALRAYEDALQFAEAQGEPVPQATADLHVGMSELHRERHELEAATKHLQKSEALGDQASLPENRYRWFVSMARIRQTEGELDAALDLLGEAQRLYLRGFLPDVRPIGALKARFWAAQGRFADALKWAEEQSLSSTDPLTYLREFEHITLARILIAEYRARPEESVIRGALGLLGRLLEAGEAGGRIGSVNEILILQALAHHVQGDVQMALVPLRRALTQAEPEGYVHVFADEGEPMAALLDDAAQQGIVPDYIRRLRRAFVVVAGDTRGPQSITDPLSERELQVLRLLRTELGGPEIARRLFVSINTLRTHTKHIFAKLEVNSRPAAVRRAEEQGLL
ncbi:LuxR C-terminal-related transcriptional regulator [Arthrobacter sp. H5]|uniref:LuxR C-terminal-related transcriptional regulator n=1 Tax=Arthrobacter sp. H5 TaxID=1267973 RepID=UPI000488AC9E|nr:LuxR C-terminal-related transcriptional regulator [Arthrobacter sp. H5]